MIYKFCLVNEKSLFILDIIEKQILIHISMYKKIVKICIFLDCDTNKKIKVFKNSYLSIIIFVIITYIVH